MTVLAFLRHGETLWTQERRIQGRTDIPLSARGKASLAHSSIPDECRDFRAASSPLVRCIGTAVALKIEGVTLDDRLAEMSWGDWEGRSLQELRAELGEEMRRNEARGFDFRPPGGESPREVLARARDFLADVAASRQATVAITHRGLIRVVCAWALGWDMQGRPPMKLDWSALHFFRLDNEGVPGLMKLNVPLVARLEPEAAA